MVAVPAAALGRSSRIAPARATLAPAPAALGRTDGSAAPQRRHAIQLAGTRVRQLGHRFTGSLRHPRASISAGTVWVL